MSVDAPERPAWALPATPGTRARRSATVPSAVGRRLLAHVVDMLAVGGLAAAAYLPTGSVLLGAIVAAEAALGLVVWEARTGRTLGKSLLGIRAAQAGAPYAPGLRREAVRAALLGAAHLAVLVGQFALIASAALDRRGRGQAWHDRAAGTAVLDVRESASAPTARTAPVHAPAVPGAAPVWQVPAAGGNAPPQHANVPAGWTPAAYGATAPDTHRSAGAPAGVHGTAAAGHGPAAVPAGYGQAATPGVRGPAMPAPATQGPAVATPGAYGHAAAGPGAYGQAAATPGARGPATAPGAHRPGAAPQVPGRGVDGARPGSWNPPGGPSSPVISAVPGASTGRPGQPPAAPPTPPSRAAAPWSGPPRPGAVPGTPGASTPAPGRPAAPGRAPVAPPSSIPEDTYLPSAEDAGHAPEPQTDQEDGPGSVVPGGRGAVFVLTVDDGQAVTVTGSGLLGRRPSAAGGDVYDHLVAIDDPGRSLSRTHARFGVDDGELWVEDRGSANGTVVVSADGVPTRVFPGKRVTVPDEGRIELGERVVTVARWES